MNYLITFNLIQELPEDEEEENLIDPVGDFNTKLKLPIC